MKEYYQPKGGKKGKFTLRENTYRRTRYLIADYPYFKWLEAYRENAETNPDQVAESIAEYHKDVKGIQRTGAFAGGCSYDPAKGTAGTEPDPDQLYRYIAAIEQAQEYMPDEYMDHIMSHIVYKVKYKDMKGVDEKRLKIWVQRFIWYVAHYLGDA